MRVLHIINNLGSGGAENLINNLLPLMKEQGIDVELLLLTTKDSMYYESLKNKIKIIVSPIENIKSFKQIRYIKSLIKGGNYDIVHAHLFPVLYWASLAIKQIKKSERPKLIYTEHSTNNRRRKWYLRLIERVIYKSYDKIIAISDGVNKSLSKWLGEKQSKKIITIFNGIPLDKFKDALPYKKEELIPTLKETDKLVLMVGRFSDQKDQKTLIKAMTSLSDEYKLILVGEGPNRDSCELLVKELNLTSKIYFLGRRNDVERITKTADICVVSSHWEGFGLVAVEAMAAGKPVIGSNVDGLKDVIEKVDYLFEKGNGKELAQKIVYLVLNKKLDNEYYKLFEKRTISFSIEKTSKEYQKSYQNLINKGELYE